MRNVSLMVAAIALVVACGKGTEPTAYGSLDSRIIRGAAQSYTAGGITPDVVIDLVFRNPITGRVIHRPSTWERLLLPKVAYALQVTGIKVQPNSVVCVREDQQVLIPLVRCVNSDAEGNTRFDFMSTTKAGTHQALIQATYGLETTIPDTVTIAVAPDVYATSALDSGWTFFQQTETMTFPERMGYDKYGNPVPVRLEFLPDAYGETPAGMFPGFKLFSHTLSDTLGTAGARTVAVDSISGPDEIDGRGVRVVCGTANVITPTGISSRGTYIISKGGNRVIRLGPYSDVTKRTSCPS